MGLLKRIVIFILAAVAIAAGVWLVGSRLMGAPESKENSVRWPFGLGTIDEVPARFPKSPNDATADRVKSIARRLAPTDQTLRPAIQSYLSKAVAQSNDHVEAPPAAIRHFLDEHVAAIDDLRTTLAGGAPPPRWAIDISQDSPHPLVDLTAQMSLVRALATDAFDHHNRGDDTTAWRDAEAGWMLAQGLWAQPDLFSRMIALSATRMMNAVAAKLPTPAPAWHGELLAFDADRAFAAAMQFNAWRAMTSWQRALPPPSPGDDGNRLWRGAAGAIVRNVSVQRAAKYAASMRASAEEMARLPSCRAAPSHANIDAATAARSRLNRFHIERESAAKLLALKELRRRSGEWPEAMPGIGTSVCGEDSWRYQREVDGSMSLSFVKPLTEDGTAVLPLSFRYPK